MSLKILKFIGWVISLLRYICRIRTTSPTLMCDSHVQGNRPHHSPGSEGSKSLFVFSLLFWKIEGTERARLVRTEHVPLCHHFCTHYQFRDLHIFIWVHIRYSLTQFWQCVQKWWFEFRNKCFASVGSDTCCVNCHTPQTDKARATQDLGPSGFLH